jgi:hypothetical protein
MQHAPQPHGAPPPGGASPLDHSFVLVALWPSLSTDDRRALRGCSTTIRDAVDALADCVVQGQAESPAPALSGTTVARLVGVHTVTLRSMTCLRRMLLVAPDHGPAGGVFPLLKSLKLHLVGFAPCTSAMQAPCA